MKKRISSIVLAVGMLLSCVTVANASAFTQNPQAAQFNAFGGYVKTSASTDKENLVDGWDDTPADNATAVGNYGTFSQSDTSTGNSYIKIANGTHMVKIFDEVAKSGVLHLSFDYMYGGDESGKVFYVEAIKNSHSNLTGHTAKADGTGTDNVTMVKTIHDGSPLQVLNGTTDEAWNSYLDGKWHKFDIVFDFPKSDYIVYADGVKLGTADINKGIKGVEIRDTSTYNKTGIYLDNVALYHYPGVPNMTAVEMAADCGTTGVMSAAGGKLNIGFSEYISGYTPNTADFKITNKASGAVVTATGAEKTDTGVLLTLPALEPGSYEVSFVNESVVGAISGAKILGKASFMAGATSISQSADNRYLLRESFDKYNGGIPAGWAPLLTAQTVAAESRNLEKTEGVSGDAVKVKGNGDIFYEFPTPISSGELNVEFDINSADGIWGMGFLHGKDFADSTVFQPNSIEAGTTLDQRRKRSLLIGNEATTETDAAKLKYNVKRSIENGFENEFTDVTLEKNQWTHVKVKFNFEERMTHLTIGDKETSFKMNDYYFFAYPYKGVSDTSKITSFYGFKALRLAALGGEGFAVDNVNVYTKGSYNLYEDFDSWTTDTTSKHRAAIFDYNNARQTDKHTIEAVAGRTGEAGDTAIKITRIANGGLVMPLVSPVTKNHNFNVEFDFKQSGVTYADTLALGLLTTGDFNIGLTDNSTIKGNERVVFATSGYREGYETHVDDIKAGSLFFGGGGLNRAGMPLFTSDKTTIEQYDIAADKWYHINLKVRGKLYELDVTDEAGTTKSYYMVDGKAGADGSVKLNSYSKQVNNDTYAIGFFNPRAVYKKDGDTVIGSSTTIDNVKVYEIDAPARARIESAKAIYANGTVDIDSTIPAGADKLEIVVSVPFRTTKIAASATADYDVLTSNHISMTYADTGASVGTISVGTDNKTITVDLDTVEAGRPVVFEIYNEALWQDSYISSEENLTVEFMFEEGDGVVEVDDFRIYEYQSVTQTVKENDVTISGWTPVIESTLANQYTADDMFKLSVAGYNTSSVDKDLTAIFAVYKDGRLEDVVFNNVAAPKYQQFEASIYSNNTTEDLTGANATTIDITPDSKIKCFLWEDINKTLFPVKAGLDYNTWASNAE